MFLIIYISLALFLSFSFILSHFLTNSINDSISLQYEPESRYKFEEVTIKLTKLIDNHNEFYLKSEINCDLNGDEKQKPINKRNSVDVPFNLQQNQEKVKKNPDPDLESVEESLSSLQHRRSLSENIISFPSHTTPSDKARCHPLNRNASRTGQTKTYSNATLRKEAELMLLMDSHYKPCQKKDNLKSNPFTALAQLRGVKKILGANVPTSLNIDSSDLFSSCFERTSPFLEDLNDFNNSNKNNNKKSLSNQIDINLPKSLPNSPRSSRKFQLDSEPMNRPDKKYFPELSSHPLYKNHRGLDVEPVRTFTFAVPSLSSDEKKQKKTTITASATHSYSKLVDKCEVDTNLVYDASNLLTRRGSTESGFYSCLNEDFSSSRASCFCPIDRLTFNHNCYRFLRKDDITEVSNITLNDSSSVANTSATVSSLRSLDDLDLSESKKRNQNLNQIDLDARSVDIGLINRLALDTEINQFIQKSQFSNQLLYCKNRTSSIYTDSSDDISSLAGSDSLWDEGCGFITNTRSAQIAKIVEYFERKGQNFKTFSVPESLKAPQTHTCINFCTADGVGQQKRQYYTNYSTDSRNKFLCNYFNVIRNDYELSNGSFTTDLATNFQISKDLVTQESVEQASANVVTPTKNDYESFCLELDKKSPQNLKICDGLVKSKLEFFDKLKKGSPVEK